jgi:catechol 2,3-dioxygenase-like lactoylglutathione lyase family enzyme
MLGEHPIAPVLLAEDLAAARKFYHDTLGLQIVREDENAIVFRCGSGTHLDVTKSTVGTADRQTQAAWQVSDIRAEVAELRARSVKIEDYDTPGLKTEDGIADIGFAWPPGSSTQERTPSASSRSRSSRLTSGFAWAPDDGRRATERAALGGQRPRWPPANIRTERRISRAPGTGLSPAAAYVR